MKKYFKQFIATLTICSVLTLGVLNSVKAQEAKKINGKQNPMNPYSNSKTHADHGMTMLLTTSFIFFVLAVYNKSRNDSYEQA